MPKSRKGRPRTFYGKYGFDLVEVDGQELIECMNCKSTMKNKATDRMEKHSNKCRGGGSSVPDEPLPESLAIPLSSETTDQNTPKTGKQKVALRQQTITSFADKMDETEAKKLIDYVAVFFFACRIPFNIISNFFFRSMIFALRPGFKKHLPCRQTLGSTLLDRQYQICIQRDSKNMPSQSVLLLDGWKNKSSNEKNVAFMLHNPMEGRSFFINSYTLQGEDKEDAENLYRMVSFRHFEF